MQRTSYWVGVAKSAVTLMVLVMSLSLGCYKQPSAERLDFDPDTVQTLREEIKSVDWNE